jgi:hypothetical protein
MNLNGSLGSNNAFPDDKSGLIKKTVTAQPFTGQGIDLARCIGDHSLPRRFPPAVKHPILNS